jgi:hypothetical protein
MAVQHLALQKPGPFDRPALYTGLSLLYGIVIVTLLTLLVRKPKSPRN